MDTKDFRLQLRCVVPNVRMLRLVSYALILGGVSSTLFQCSRREPPSPIQSGAENLPPVQRLDLEVGARVCRPDKTPWPKAHRIVLVVGSTTCPVCSATKPFTEVLFERCTKLAIPVFYIMPDRPDNDAEAERVRSLGRHVLRADLRSFGAVRIPTTISVNSDGTILAMWTGSVAESMAEALITEVTSGTMRPLYERISRAELKSAAQQVEKYDILALDRLGSAPFYGAHYKVLPARDLSVRAKYELTTNSKVFVDCDTGGGLYVCQEALLTLAKMGFQQLVAIDLPRRGGSDYCGAP